MQIEVNGETRDVQAQRLDEALVELGFTEAAIATAVNGDFIPASARAGRQLQAGDRLEVLAPMQGG
ncbi:MAG: sulfur carrier protein ThiS [Pseudomonadota bacterium]